MSLFSRGRFHITEKAFAAVKSIQMIDQQKSPVSPKGSVAHNRKT